MNSINYTKPNDIVDLTSPASMIKHREGKEGALYAVVTTKLLHRSKRGGMNSEF